jgi:hypothetical protein
MADEPTGMELVEMMKNLQRRNKDKPVVLTEEEQKLPLAERMKVYYKKQAQKDTAKMALLLDVSLSMDDPLSISDDDWRGSYTASHGRTKWDELCDIATKLMDEFPGVRQFSFASNCREIKKGQEMANDSEGLPHPGGGTAMHMAFLEMKKQGVEHVLLVTDGAPDDKKAAVTAAAGLTIDCFYVGPDPAPDLLKKISESTGGSYGKASLSVKGQLEAGIRGLLTAGGASDTKEAIKL